MSRETSCDREARRLMSCFWSVLPSVHKMADVGCVRAYAFGKKGLAVQPTIGVGSAPLHHTLGRCRLGALPPSLFFLQVRKPILDVVPMRDKKEVVQVRRHPRGPARLRPYHGHKQEGPRRCLHRCTSEYPASAQELQHLDLHSLRRAVEVPREDDLGNGEGLGRRGRVR